MTNLSKFLFCDRCKFFISKNNSDGLCPQCHERLKPPRRYDTDEFESKRFLYGECPKCESIFFRKIKCLLCKYIQLRRIS